jgi:RNA polymerase sigma-70 factor (ECF subfamily)
LGPNTAENVNLAKHSTDGGSGGDAVTPHVPEHFVDVYEAYFDFAWRSVAALGVPAERLEDAVQDVMLVVCRRLAEFEGRSTLRTWIFGIAHHVASNHRRQQRRKGGLEELPASLPSPEADPQQTAMDREDLRFVQRFMNDLDDLSRSLFFCFFVERMSAREVAEALELEIDAVYVRVKTLRRRFHVALDKRSEDGP